MIETRGNWSKNISSYYRAQRKEGRAKGKDGGSEGGKKEGRKTRTLMPLELKQNEKNFHEGLN